MYRQPVQDLARRRRRHAGTPAPTVFDPVTNETTFQFSTEAVYLAFDPTLPSGTYYVHVTDHIDFQDMVLSTNDPMDRFVNVDNDNGVITLSLPYSTNPNPAFGVGLNGTGQSLLLTPFTTNPNEPCRFKAWFGDNWDLTNGPSNPYLLAGGLHPTTNQCAVRSYHGFRIGTGNGTAITGSVFDDLDRDGVRDAGEAGLANWEIQLVGSTTSASTVTDANGDYRFDNVACDNYAVEITLPTSHVATTAASQTIEVCGCADVSVAGFGTAPAMLACDAKPVRFWSHHHGLELICQYGVLPTLPALGIVNSCGRRVAPGNKCQLRWYLRCANSWNMAYKLSAQIVAMHANIMTGKVDPNCVLDDPCLGQISAGDLLAQAIASVWAHPYTGWCSPHRHAQKKLMKALRRANRNQIWM